MILNFLQRTCILLGSLLTIMLIADRPQQDIEQKEENNPIRDVEKVLTDLETAVSAKDFAKAINLLDEFEMNSFFQELERRDGQVGNATEFPVKFLAYAEDLILIPGIPTELRVKVFQQEMFAEIAGTGDDSEAPAELHRSWFETASNFVLRYNTRMYRRAIARGKVSALPYKSNEVRRFLHLDQATWDNLPVEVQVTLEIMVNETTP